MPLDPDTDMQYRKGGKIMKKMPRKFSAGGATPAPATKPAPKGGPKELQEEAEKVRQEKLDEAQRKAGQRRPDLSKPFKKGGAVRKFNGEDGSVVEQPELREEREGKDIYYTGRFKGEDGDETYRRAYEQANRLRTPSGAEEISGSARTGLKEPSVRKAAPKATPKVSVAPSKRAEEAPKETAKAEAPKETAKAETKGPEKDFERAGKTWEYVKSLGRRALTTSSGKNISGFAKGGGVEAKGKTKGKIVKMAKGGSVRGYGISKVTNKTKYV